MAMHFIVATFNVTNMFTIKKLADDKYVGLEGTEFELLDILSKFVNFTYELVCPTEGMWGRVDANGNWDGLVGMLQRKEADLSVLGIVLTYARSKVVDFPFPYDVSIDTFMIKKAGLLATNYYFAYPFQLSIWICLAVSIIVCSSFLLLLQHANLIGSRNILVSFVNMISSAEILIGSKAITKGFNKATVRIFFALSALPLRILMFCFSGLLLSFLMTPMMENQIASLEQLAAASRDGRVKVTTLRGTFIVSFLQNPATNLLTDLGVHLRKHPEATVKSAAEGIQMVNSGCAIIAQRYFLVMSVKAHGEDQNIFVSEDGLGIGSKTFIFKKKFCCIDEFNKAIIRLQQAGIYQKILNDKYFKLELKTKLHTKADQSLRPISIADLFGVFKILFCGCAIAFVVLIWERISKNFKNCFKICKIKKSRLRRFEV